MRVCICVYTCVCVFSHVTLCVCSPAAAISEEDVNPFAAPASVNPFVRCLFLTVVSLCVQLFCGCVSIACIVVVVWYREIEEVCVLVACSACLCTVSMSEYVSVLCFCVKRKSALESDTFVSVCACKRMAASALYRCE